MANRVMEFDGLSVRVLRTQVVSEGAIRIRLLHADGDREWRWWVFIPRQRYLGLVRLEVSR
jgi:hypothetical protein